MNRPKQVERQVSTYFSEREYRKFAKKCDEHERSMSAQLRILARHWMNGGKV